jgi:hypothetical protein
MNTYATNDSKTAKEAIFNVLLPYFLLSGLASFVGV